MCPPCIPGANLITIPVTENALPWKRLDIENSKVTLADFIRLTQLERELEEEEQPREIIVTWKDPAEKRYGLK